jgi:hypothetical protein
MFCSGRLFGDCVCQNDLLDLRDRAHSTIQRPITLKIVLFLRSAWPGSGAADHCDVEIEAVTALRAMVQEKGAVGPMSSQEIAEGQMWVGVGNLCHWN